MTVEIIIRCMICNKLHTLNVDKEALRRWENGEVIQKCFPNMSADHRELMISNICPKCFDELNMEEDDEF